MTRARRVAPGILVALSLGAFTAEAGGPPSAAPSLGSEAPALDLQGPAGDTLFSLASFRGKKPVALVFSLPPKSGGERERLKALYLASRGAVEFLVVREVYYGDAPSLRREDPKDVAESELRMIGLPFFIVTSSMAGPRLPVDVARWVNTRALCVVGRDGRIAFLGSSLDEFSVAVEEAADQKGAASRVQDQREALALLTAAQTRLTAAGTLRISLRQTRELQGEPATRLATLTVAPAGRLRLDLSDGAGAAGGVIVSDGARMRVALGGGAPPREMVASQDFSTRVVIDFARRGDLFAIPGSLLDATILRARVVSRESGAIRIDCSVSADRGRVSEHRVWLDAATGLPMRRTFRPYRGGAEVQESYEVRVDPFVDPGTFRLTPVVEQPSEGQRPR